MRCLLWILCLAGIAAKCDDSNNYYVIQMPEEDSHRTLAKPFRVFWNVPTIQCKSKGIPFEHLYERYGIIQNDNDSFRGEKISILYDPGLFPALLKNESTGEYKFRNGGVPQEGDLEKHMVSFRNNLEQSIPDPNFSGIGIIDFESWRPIFRQNFGVLGPYKEVSYQIERKKHWIWPEPWIKAEAKQRFEEKARAFMQTTLSIAQQLRPRAQWGYYGFPYCFNMAASNMREGCADRVSSENDDTYWLWLESSSLYPSVYSSNSLTTDQLAQMVRGRLREAARVRKIGTPILPYFWFRYHNKNGGFLSEPDLQTAIKTMYDSDASGFILWGSSFDVNTGEKCKNLLHYIEKQLGPEVAKYTKYYRTQSIYDDINTVSSSDNDVESSSNTVTSRSNSTHVFSVTAFDENDGHKTSTHKYQSNLEYYDNSDDDLGASKKTSTKGVLLQADLDYFWFQPQNLAHNIRKEVENKMRSKSYVSNIDLGDTITTPTILEFPSELEPPLMDLHKTTNKEDFIETILIKSTTEDEFMDGITTSTEKIKVNNIENYESIDIMYDDDEISTKLNSNRHRDKTQENTETQNERLSEEFVIDEIGSQSEDVLSKDGSHDKLERVIDTDAVNERNADIPNCLIENNSSIIADGITIRKEAPYESTTIISLPVNYSTEIADSITIKTDAPYESTTVVSLPDTYSTAIVDGMTIKTDSSYEYTTVISLPDKNSTVIADGITIKTDAPYASTTVVRLNENNSTVITDGFMIKTDAPYEYTTVSSLPDNNSNLVADNVKIKTDSPYKSLTAISLPRNNSTVIADNNTIKADKPFESTDIVRLSTFFHIHPSSTHLTPIGKEEPPVQPLPDPKSNGKTMKFKSKTEVPINLKPFAKEQTFSDSKDNKTTVIQITETNNTVRKPSTHFNFYTTSTETNDDKNTNESILSTDSFVLNTTLTNKLLILHKQQTHNKYNDTTVNVEVDFLTIESINNKYDDKNSTDNYQHGIEIEITTKETTNTAESATISTNSSINVTNDKEIIKGSQTPKVFTSQNEKKGSSKTTTDRWDSATESSEIERLNASILPDKVSSSGSHSRVGGFRYYYCVIFYFYSVSKCLCDYYGQCT